MTMIDKIGTLGPSIPSTQVRRKTRPARDSNREKREGTKRKDSGANDGKRHIDELA